MDTIDKKILYILSSNSKMSYSNIGKLVNLSPEGVGYRIKKLIEDKIIHSFITYVNFGKLGYTDYGVYFSLEIFDEKKEQEFVNFLKNHNRVSFFAKIGGGYDYVIGIMAKNPNDFNLVFNEIKNASNNSIGSYDIAIRLKLVHYNFDFLDIKPPIKNTPQIYFNITEKNEIIDEIDSNILKKLAINCRKSLVEIAKELKIPYTSLLSRIKKLEQKQIITGYYLQINPKSLGYSYYTLILDNREGGGEKEKEIENFCANNPSVIFFIKTIGAWDMEIGIYVKDQKELEKFVYDMKKQFPKLKIKNAPIFFDVLKYDMHPF